MGWSKYFEDIQKIRDDNKHRFAHSARIEEFIEHIRNAAFERQYKTEEEFDYILDIIDKKKKEVIEKIKEDSDNLETTYQNIDAILLEILDVLTHPDALREVKINDLRSVLKEKDKELRLVKRENSRMKSYIEKMQRALEQKEKANQKKIRKLEKNKLEIESLSEENREMKNALREKDVVHLENKVKRLQRRLTDCIKREEIARRAKH